MTLKSVLAWLFGIIFGLLGLLLLFTSFIGGLSLLIISAILIPPFSRLLEEKLKIKLSIGVKIAIIIVGIILAVMVSPNEKKSNIQNVITDKNKQSSQVIDLKQTLMETANKLPTKYKLGALKEMCNEHLSANCSKSLIVNNTLIQEGYSINFYETVPFGTQGIMEIHRLGTETKATSEFNRIVNSVKGERGYEELSSTSNCFKWQKDYGLALRQTEVCHKGELITVDWSQS